MAELPPLGSPSFVEIGSRDIDATVRFFAAVDFVIDRHDGDAVVMHRGLGHRTELIISPAPQGRRLTNYDLGPRGLDIYTRDIEASIAATTAAGGRPGPIGVVEIGPMKMRQVTVWGPDGEPLVFIENEQRRASLLDDHPDELHSEIHSLVWAVADRDAESAWWADHGLVKGMDISFGDPAVAEFMQLPDGDVTLDMVMLANPANDPIRLEVLRFAEHPNGAPFTGADEAGIQAIGFDVAVDTPQRITSPDGIVVAIR